MSQNKLYVGNLPYQIDEEDLRKAFEQYGDIVELKLIKDHETGKSKGFCFLTMESQQAAENSLKMNGEAIGGRNIKVNIARENKQTRNNDSYGERW